MRLGCHARAMPKSRTDRKVACCDVQTVGGKELETLVVRVLRRSGGTASAGGGS